MSETTKREADKPIPPGDLGLPFLGQSLAFLEDPFALIEERTRAHGPVFKMRLLGDDVICFVGPEAMTFFNDDRWITREGASPPHLQQILDPAAAPFLDGPAQKRRRAHLLHAFTREALVGYQPVIERIIARYLAKWVGAGELRGAQELGKLCFSIAQSLFLGLDPDADGAALATSFDRATAGVFAIPVNLPFTTYGHALASRDEFRQAIGVMVDAYEPGTANHVLQRLIEARDADGVAMTLDEVKLETFHFFVASYSVLQGALCNLVIALAKHPDTMRRAREEARAMAASGPLGEGAFELGYVGQVTREVRRWSKLLPTTFFGRIREDCEFLGYRLPKGWKAVGSLYSTMHDAKVFSLPDTFDPDRFSPERAEDTKRPNTYVAHGSGPWEGHRCAGEALADLLLGTFTVLALRDARWELPAQDLAPKRGGIVPLPRGGLLVAFSGIG